MLHFGDLSTLPFQAIWRKDSVTPEFYLDKLQEMLDEDSFSSATDIDESDFFELSDHKMDSGIEGDVLQHP